MIRQPPVALYVHLPFCIARCPYCDFVVYAGGDARGPRARTGRLYEAIAAELELRADGLDAAFGPPDPPRQAESGRGGGNRRRPPLESVYFGGGTPSLVPAQTLARLLDIVRERYGLAPDAEVTLESNPGPDERGDLAAFRRLGINRLSIGAQSLHAAELKRLGRCHSPEDVVSAVAEARAAGIRSVSLDLLYDVPGQSLASWDATLRSALALEPDHLSLYALTLDDPDAEGLTGDAGDHLPTSTGARRWRERVLAEQDEDRAAGQYGLAFELLASKGWHGYEISNWSLPGHESRHNLAYWQRRPYEAVGPGAHAFDGAVRRWNAAAMEPYIAALVPGRGGVTEPPGGCETLADETATAERMILALRLDSGVPAEWAGEQPLASTSEWALEAGLMERVVQAGSSRLRLTLRGRLLSNEVFARLL